jgi:hypothetical protein
MHTFISYVRPTQRISETHVRTRNSQLETGGAALRQCIRDILLEFLAAATASTSSHPNVVALRGISFLPSEDNETSREQRPEFRLAFELCNAGTIFSVLFPANGSPSQLRFHDRLRLAREVKQQSAHFIFHPDPAFVSPLSASPCIPLRD